MGTKTATIHTRTEPAIKAQAEAILAKLGISTSEAINMYLNQIIHHNGLPFEVRVPNAVTLQAFQEAREGKTYRAHSVQELFEKLNADD